MKHFVRFVLVMPLIVQLFANPSAEPVAAVANKTDGLNATSLKSPNATDAMSTLAKDTKALNGNDMEKQGTQFLAAIFIAMQKFIQEVMTALSPIPTTAPGMDMLSKMPKLLNPVDIGKDMMDDMKKLLGGSDSPAKDSKPANGTETSKTTPSPLNPLEIGKNMMDGMMKILGGPDATPKDPKDSKPANSTVAPASNSTANATEPAANNTSIPTPPKDMAKAVEDAGKNVLDGITGLFSG